jgi:nitrogen fixation/metabolism regulation signal transduction histidine kinase
VQQVEAMKEMVNAFSEYARAPRFEMTPVDLNRLVMEVTELYRAQHPDRRILIRVALDQGLPWLVADQGRLRQLLHNLLTNAVEALEGQPAGEIVISTRAGEREGEPVALVMVEDNGPGFQRELIHQVFDPYVTSKARGTGLGLAIVRKIAEEHGGHVEAENRTEGGARIRLELPMGEAGVQDASRGEPTRRETRRESA